jgi:hypothetical protein
MACCHGEAMPRDLRRPPFPVEGTVLGARLDMKLLSTFVHGAMDYSMAAVLIAFPWLCGWEGDLVESRVPMGLGYLLFAYSLATRYELGAVRVLPVRVHLLLDELIGGLLTLSPWLFGFAQRVWFPHVALGVVLVLMSLVTERASRRALALPEEGMTPVQEPEAFLARASLN